jgi:hypothetical protein
VVAVAGKSSSGGGGRRGTGFTSGPRRTVGISGGRTWLQIPLTWPIILVMVATAVLRWMIRVRVELSVIIAGYLAGWWLAGRLGGWRIVGIITLVAVLAVLAWPAGRRWLVRFVVAHTWCVLSRHRIRGALAQAGVSSGEGRIPWVVKVRPTPVGTRVHLWMRTGTAVEQLGDEGSVKVGIIRAACWARDVRIQRNPQWSHLVQLHLVRRDSLAAGVRVSSQLADLLAAATSAVKPASHEPGAPEPVLEPVGSVNRG